VLSNFVKMDRIMHWQKRNKIGGNWTRLNITTLNIAFAHKEVCT